MLLSSQHRHNFLNQWVRLSQPLYLEKLPKQLFTLIYHLMQGGQPACTWEAASSQSSYSFCSWEAKAKKATCFSSTSSYSHWTLNTCCSYCLAPTCILKVSTLQVQAFLKAVAFEG